jgi:hypothetical protein
MNRKFFWYQIFICIATILVVGFAPKTYRYQCPKCKLVQEYGSLGTKKCPNDGRIMIRKL